MTGNWWTFLTRFPSICSHSLSVRFVLSGGLRRYGSGEARLTVEQNYILPNVPDDKVEALLKVRFSTLHTHTHQLKKSSSKVVADESRKQRTDDISTTFPSASLAAGASSDDWGGLCDGFQAQPWAADQGPRVLHRQPVLRAGPDRDQGHWQGARRGARGHHGPPAPLHVQGAAVPARHATAEGARRQGQGQGQQAREAEGKQPGRQEELTLKAGNE